METPLWSLLIFTNDENYKYLWILQSYHNVFNTITSLLIIPKVGPTQNDRKQVLTRKESSQGEDPRQVESPRPPSSTGPGENLKPQHQREVIHNPNDYIPPRNIKLVDDNQFCEHFCDYLNENSTDFIIVGVIGTTSVGKSSILNALINPRNNPASLIQKPSSENGQQQTNGNVSTTSQRMFRVQTFEKQMLSEHCTNGM